MEFTNLVWTISVLTSFVVGYFLSKRCKPWIVWLVLLLHPFIIGYILQDAIVPVVAFIMFALGWAIARVNTKYDKLAFELIDAYLFFYKVGGYEEVINFLKKKGIDIRKPPEIETIAWDIPIENILWRFYYNKTNNLGLSLTSFNLIGAAKSNSYNAIQIGTLPEDNGLFTLNISSQGGKEEEKLISAFIKECEKRKIAVYNF